MKIISNQQMLDYIDDKWESDYDLLLTYHKDTNTWVACDDSTGQKWVEEFDLLQNAIDWLNGEFEL
jgi:hypothetical protein